MILRNFLLIVFLFVIGILTGCTPQNTTTFNEKISTPTLYAMVARGTYCAEYKSVGHFIDAAINNNQSKFLQMIKEGKIIKLEYDMPVIVSDPEPYRGLICVIFRKGEYKAQFFYVPEENIYGFYTE